MSEYRAELFEGRSSLNHADMSAVDRLDWARQAIARLERGAPKGEVRGGEGAHPNFRIPTLCTGIQALDAILPNGGLSYGSVQEVLGLAARRFAIRLLRNRLAQTTSPALWVLPARLREVLYGPGLVSLGVDPARIIIARYRSTEEGLWVLEEAFKSGAFALVLGEPDGMMNTTSTRRLQLAAEAGDTLGVLISDASLPLCAPGAATGRWRAEPLAADITRDPALSSTSHTVERRFSLSLERYRGMFDGPDVRSWIVADDLTQGAARP